MEGSKAEAQEQRPLEPQQTIPVAEPTPQSHGTKPWIIIITLLLLGLTSYLGYQNWQLRQQLTEKTSPAIPTESASPTPDPTDGWKTYTIKTLDIQLKLPSTLTKFGDLREETRPGETGSKLCAVLTKKNSKVIQRVEAGTTFCLSDYFVIGATSVDFSEGRGGVFSDLQGYVQNNDKYYAKFVGNSTIEIPHELVTEFTNQNKVSILKVKSGTYEGPMPFIYEGSIGAIINTKDPAYTGFTIEMQLTEELDEDMFDQILSTFKFNTPEQVSRIPGWKKYTNTKYNYSIEVPQYYNAVNTGNLDYLPQVDIERQSYIMFIKYTSEEAKKISSEELKTYDQYRFGAEYESIAILIYGSTKENSCLDAHPDLQTQTIIVDGLKASKWKSKQLKHPLIGDMEVRVEKNSQCYILNFLRDPANVHKSEALFDQMLASFGFTD